MNKRYWDQAVVESEVTGTATIRHKQCEYLVSRPGRCSKCISHRRSLRAMLSRFKSRSNEDCANVSSHANYRYGYNAVLSSHANTIMYLPKPMLIKCAHCIHKKYQLVQRRIARLKSRVRKLVTSKGVKVDKKLDNDLKHIMQNNLSEIAEKHHTSVRERNRCVWIACDRMWGVN